MIKANFNSYNAYVTDSLYQWDKDRILSINGLNLDVAPEIHFTNISMQRAVARQSVLSDGVVTVKIPNSFLQVALTIMAYIGIWEGDTFRTVEVVEIPVIPRVKPSDYTLTDDDEEVYSFNRLEALVSDLSSKNDANTNKIEAVVDQIDAHGLDISQIKQNIISLEQADVLIKSELGKINDDLGFEIVKAVNGYVKKYENGKFEAFATTVVNNSEFSWTQISNSGIHYAKFTNLGFGITAKTIDGIFCNVRNNGVIWCASVAERASMNSVDGVVMQVGADKTRNTLFYLHVLGTWK